MKSYGTILVCLLRVLKIVSSDGRNSLRPKFNQDALSVVPDIANSLIEPYFCNCELPTEQEISVIQKLKANKTEDEKIVF